MTTFQLQLSDYEITTRKLFNAALEGDKWSSLRVMIACVFVANASSALSFDGIVARMVANNHLAKDQSPEALKAIKNELSRLVREKVLRSRRAGAGSAHPSTTLWEVNY